MRLDDSGNKKKLSKRDMGANLDDYSRMGYAPACVCEYIMTLLNSNYEEWHMQNPDQPYTAFPFNIIFSCHDHQLTQTVANRIIEINADGSITDRMCTYDEYVHLNELEAQP